MQTKSLNAKNMLTANIPYLPTVSIILPFEPKMFKTEAENNLRSALTTAEAKLLFSYPKKKITSLITKLHHLARTINYNTHTQSIAIFVSPLVAQIYYLNIPVVEKVVIDDSFAIRDIVYNKKKAMHHLIISISKDHTKMYLGSEGELIKLVLHQPNDTHAYKEMAGKTANFTDAEDKKEIAGSKHLHRIDCSLSIMMKSYPFPVFVLGSEKMIAHFKKISKNTKRVAEYIYGGFEELPEHAIKKALQPHIENWQKVQSKQFIAQIEEATGQGTASWGIRNVWKDAVNINSRLLLVEKDYNYPEYNKADSKYSKNNLFYIKDIVDDIIAKVLKNGGDIEFVENGLLNNYEHIALLKHYA
jgi:hypothetical protein